MTNQSQNFKEKECNIQDTNKRIKTEKDLVLLQQTCYLPLVGFATGAEAGDSVSTTSSSISIKGRDESIKGRNGMSGAGPATSNKNFSDS